jgi:hypothetical protein
MNGFRRRMLWKENIITSPFSKIKGPNGQIVLHKWVSMFWLPIGIAQIDKHIA